MKYFLNTRGQEVVIYDDESEEYNKIQTIKFTEFTKSYYNNEIKIDNTISEKEIKGSSYLYNKKKSEDEIDSLKKYLDNNKKSILDENKEINHAIFTDNEIFFYTKEGNNNVKTITMNSFYYESKIIDFLDTLTKIENSENFSKESLENLNKFKTINFKKTIDDKYYIEFDTKIKSKYFNSLFFKKLNKDLYGKGQIRDNKFYLNNINEIYFIKTIFEDKLIYDLSLLSIKDREEIEKTEKIIENKITQDSYEENVHEFIDNNNGNVVISDSVEDKNNAVVSWLNKTKEKVMILGKPESLEKYKLLNTENATFVNIEDLSNRKNINKINTTEHFVEIKNNKLLIDNDEIEINNVENIKLNVESNRVIVMDVKDQHENIETEDIESIIRNTEILKILNVLISEYGIEEKEGMKFLKRNLKKKNMSIILNKMFEELGIDVNSEEDQVKLKKVLKTSKKKDASIKDFVTKFSKNIEYNKKTEKFNINYEDINISFKEDKEPVNRFKELLKLIDIKNSSNFLENQLKSKNETHIINGKMFHSKIIKIQKLEKERVVSYSTEKLNKLMSETKDIERIVLLNAEKVKDPTSTISNTFLHMIKNSNFKNKIFVSSNPIYNKISEIEILFKSIDENLFEDLNRVLETYNTRQSKGYKEKFLALIAKRLILKRSNEELSSILKDTGSIKEISFKNPKEIGDLNTESLFFEDEKDKMQKKIRSLLKVIANRLDDKNDFQIANYKDFEEYKETFLGYYFENFEQFQILTGERLQSYDIKKISKLSGNEISEDEIKGLNIEQLKNKFNNNKEIMKFLNKTNKMMDRLYDKVFDIKISNYVSFDPINNQMIDGVHIKKKHLLEINELLKGYEKKDGSTTSQYLTRKEIDVIKSNLKEDNKIDSYYKGIEEDGSENIQNGLEYKINSMMTDLNYIISRTSVRISNLTMEKFKEMELPFYVNGKEITSELEINGLRNMRLPVIEKYKTLYDENITIPKAKEKLKILKKLDVRIKRELYGETSTFKEEFLKSMNLRKIRRGLSEIKIPNTLAELKFVETQKKNAMVLTTNNDVIKELETRLKSEGKNVIVVKSTNKNEVMSNLEKEKEPYVVLAGYKMLSEHIKNTFKGEIILNDLPYNFASLEQSVASIKETELNLWYLHNEDEEIEKLLKFIIINRNKEISELINSEDHLFENEDEIKIDEKFFKEEFIKNVFKSYLKNLTEEEFKSRIKKSINVTQGLNKRKRENVVNLDDDITTTFVF